MRSLQVFLCSRAEKTGHPIEDAVVDFRRLLIESLRGPDAVLNLVYMDRSTGARPGDVPHASLSLVEGCPVVVVLLGVRVGQFTLAEVQHALKCRRTVLAYQLEAAAGPGAGAAGGAPEQTEAEALIKQIENAGMVHTRIRPDRLGLIRIFQDVIRAHGSEHGVPEAPEMILAREIASYVVAAGQHLRHEVRTAGEGMAAFAYEASVGETKRTTVVCAVAGVPQVGDLDEAIKELRRERDADRLLLISPARAPSLLRERVSERDRDDGDRGVALLAFNDFLLELLDLESHFEELEDRAREWNIVVGEAEQSSRSAYIDLDCSIWHPHPDGGFRSEPAGILSGRVETWIHGRSHQPLALIGDFGEGKSWFCLHECLSLHKRVRKGEAVRLPVLLRVGDLGPNPSEWLSA